MPYAQNKGHETSLQSCPVFTGLVAYNGQELSVSGLLLLLLLLLLLEKTDLSCRMPKLHVGLMGHKHRHCYTLAGKNNF